MLTINQPPLVIQWPLAALYGRITIDLPMWRISLRFLDGLNCIWAGFLMVPPKVCEMLFFLWSNDVIQCSVSQGFFYLVRSYELHFFKEQNRAQKGVFQRAAYKESNWELWDAKHYWVHGKRTFLRPTSPFILHSI